MICPKCGAGVNAGDNFCEECGASLKKISSGTDFSHEFWPESKTVVWDNNLAAATNIGRKHLTNEDDGTVMKLKSGDSLLIVSDGVSSSFSAVSASQKAVEVILERLTNSDGPAEKLLIDAIRAADEFIKGLPYETLEDGIYGPEATVVAAIVRGNTAAIGWVGDSRAYLISSESQKLLTLDDSWVELVVKHGLMNRKQAALDKRAHYVTQVLGMHDQEIEIHILECCLEKGDILLLCSDGLWNYFQEENSLLKAIAALGEDSKAVSICEHLIGMANSAGGHDNITAALLKIR